MKETLKKGLFVVLGILLLILPFKGIADSGWDSSYSGGGGGSSYHSSGGSYHSSSYSSSRSSSSSSSSSDGNPFVVLVIVIVIIILCMIFAKGDKGKGKFGNSTNSLI